MVYHQEKVSNEKVKQTFSRFDYNGNGILSLAELDKAIGEVYPHMSKDKPAIMRAYKASDTSKDGFVNTKEFERFVDLFFYFDKIYKIFQSLDLDADRRISFEEFRKGHDLIGLKNVTPSQLKSEFNDIDQNKVLRAHGEKVGFSLKTNGKH